MPELPSDVNLHLVNNIDAAFAMKRWLGERREHDVIGFDSETSGLDAYAPDARLRMVQIGDAKTGWAVPWDLWGGVAMECLNAWDGQFTAHNLAFDATWMKVHAGWDVPWSRFDDTMIMSQVDAPGSPAGLKGLSVEHVDSRADAGEKDLKAAMKKHNWTWGTIPTDYEAYWLYSALDPVLAANLHTHFKHVPIKYAEPYDLEMSIRRICTNMEQIGMRIDLEYAAKKHAELTETVTHNKKWALDNWGFSLASGPQLADFFENTLKAEFKHRTAGGKPSVAKDQLDLFAASHDKDVRMVANYVLETRKLDKLNSAYFKNFLSMNNDGIVHPNIRTMGARTGRMSVTNPALQTIPSNDSLVRGAFIRRNEGEAIISCDYSQIEMRLLAHFSEDPALISAFNLADQDGSDFFVALGRDIYNDSEFDKKDPRRKLVKSTMYGSAYGSGVAKMATTAGVSLEQMTEVALSVFRKYPGIKRFMSEVEKMGEMREREEGVGYVLTSTGRRLPADNGKMYTLTNYILQGTAAELMKKAVVRLDAEGYGPYMQMVIHDEVVFSMPENMVKDEMPNIERAMSYVNGEYSVGLPAEPEYVGYSWGSKYAQAA